MPPSERSDGGKYEWSEGSARCFDDPPEAPLGLLFEAIFTGKRREKLKALGINSAADFSPLPPAEWEYHFRELTRPKRPDGKPIPLEEGRDAILQGYVRKAIAGECKEICQVQEGARDDTLYLACLKATSVLHGAEAEGLNIAELAEWAFWEVVEAAGGMGDESQSWDEETVRDKWDRAWDYTEEDPRNLSGVGWQTDARDDLRDILQENRSYTSRCVADVDAKLVKWLWPDRLAQGKITLIGGPPKRGKSQLTCALAAPVTKGGKWPDGTRAPRGSVAFITCGDDLADTIRPRLEAAGAEITKVHVFDLAKVKDKDGKIKAQPFNVAEHMTQLTAFVSDIGDLKLLVIDPVLAYLGKADSHKTGDVRGALLGLQTLAAQREIAVVLMNKNEGAQSTMNRMAASGAFTAVARGVWLVDFDPNDEKQERRLFVPVGANIGNDRDGFTFQIETASLPGGIVTSKVVFETDTIRVDVEEILGPHDPARQGAADFLKAELADGPRPIRELNKLAGEAGINVRTLRRAAGKLGARRVVHEGKACWSISARGQVAELDDGVLDGSQNPQELFH